MTYCAPVLNVSLQPRHIFLEMATDHMNVDDILSQLTLKEKVSLTSAESWWRTEAIRRGNKILIPHIKVSIRNGLLSKCKTDKNTHRRPTDQMALAEKVMLAGSSPLVSRAPHALVQPLMKMLLFK